MWFTKIHILSKICFIYTFFNLQKRHDRHEIHKKGIRGVRLSHNYPIGSLKG